MLIGGSRMTASCHKPTFAQPLSVDIREVSSGGDALSHLHCNAAILGDSLGLHLIHSWSALSMVTRKLAHFRIWHDPAIEYAELQFRSAG